MQNGTQWVSFYELYSLLPMLYDCIDDSVVIMVSSCAVDFEFEQPLYDKCNIEPYEEMFWNYSYLKPRNPFDSNRGWRVPWMVFYKLCWFVQGFVYYSYIFGLCVWFLLSDIQDAGHNFIGSYGERGKSYVRGDGEKSHQGKNEKNSMTRNGLNRNGTYHFVGLSF